MKEKNYVCFHFNGETSTNFISFLFFKQYLEDFKVISEEREN